MNATILPDGGLELSLEDDDREFIREHLEKWTDEDIVFRLLEPYRDNGGFEGFNAGNANPFVGLSSAPCIAESLNVNDDSTKEIVRSEAPWDAPPRYWYFERYMLDSMAEELLAHGRIVFTAAP